MLESRSVEVIVENALLVSIDLCLVSDSKILLGKRNNEPLKGNWFTPGGRIHKNESWQHALRRIGEVEVGLRGILIEDSSLMGVWDHFHINSVFCKDISTHYVNLPHYTNFKFRPEITLDNQHGDFQ